MVERIMNIRCNYCGKFISYQDIINGKAIHQIEPPLTEFSDEIEAWVIEEFAKIGLDTARSILKQDVNDLVRRTDLEEETILEVMKILSDEFNG